MLLYYLSLLDTPEDKDKFEQLYIKYRALMKHIARGYLHNDELAEEAVHDAFIKIIRYLDRIEDVDSGQTEAFVIKVIRSISIDNLEKEKKFQLVNIDDIEELATEDIDFFENLNVENLMLVLKSLPDLYRDVLELKIYYEYSARQISDVLGIPFSAARKRLERGKKYLEKVLGE